MRLLAVRALALSLATALSACFVVVKEGPDAEHVHTTASSASSSSSARATPASAQKSSSSRSVSGVFPYAIHQKTLPNGLKAIVVPMPSDGLVSYWSIV